jgi:hypothetical protein
MGAIKTSILETKLLLCHLVFREPKFDFTKKIRLAQERSRFLAEPYLAGWDRELERTGGNHVLECVSEGQLNKQLMNYVGLDEAITTQSTK